MIFRFDKYWYRDVTALQIVPDAMIKSYLVFPIVANYSHRVAFLLVNFTSYTLLFTMRPRVSKVALRKIKVTAINANTYNNWNRN